jgi:catechol 2,3-dioxygenase-like lactoylglutathione lyase family enzyme
MIRITSLDHFVLRVRDLDRALAFYRGVLGLTMEFLDEYRRGERPFVSARIGDQLLDLVPDPTYDAGEAAAKGGFLHFCVTFEGGDFPVLLETLGRHGVEIVSPDPVVRQGARGAGRSIYVRDPDGYVIELKES